MPRRSFLSTLTLDAAWRHEGKIWVARSGSAEAGLDLYDPETENLRDQIESTSDSPLAYLCFLKVASVFSRSRP